MILKKKIIIELLIQQKITNLKIWTIFYRLTFPEQLFQK